MYVPLKVFTSDEAASRKIERAMMDCGLIAVEHHQRRALDYQKQIDAPYFILRGLYPKTLDAGAVLKRVAEAAGVPMALSREELGY